MNSEVVFVLQGSAKAGAPGISSLVHLFSFPILSPHFFSHLSGSISLLKSLHPHPHLRVCFLRIYLKTPSDSIWSLTFPCPLRKCFQYLFRGHSVHAASLNLFSSGFPSTKPHYCVCVSVCVCVCVLEHVCLHTCASAVFTP